MPSADRTGHYVHISSISAYDEAAITIDEDSPLNADLADPTVEDGDRRDLRPAQGDVRTGGSATLRRGTHRGHPADLCRRTARLDRPLHVLGTTHGRGGDVAIVGPGAPLQIVDARDLGAFIVTCAESAAAGEFDAVGPWAPIEEFLATITPAGVEARFVDVGPAALEAAGIGLPLLSAEPEAAAFMTRPGDRARPRDLATASSRRLPMRRGRGT